MIKKYFFALIFIFSSIISNSQERLQYGKIITSDGDSMEVLFPILFEDVIVSDNSVKYINFKDEELNIKIKDIKQIILGKSIYSVIQYLAKKQVYNGPRKQWEEYSRYYVCRHLGDVKSNIVQIFSSIPLRYFYNFTIYTTYFHIKDNQLYEIKKIIISDKILDNFSNFPYYKKDDGSIVYMIPEKQSKYSIINN